MNSINNKFYFMPIFGAIIFAIYNLYVQEVASLLCFLEFLLLLSFPVVIKYFPKMEIHFQLKFKRTHLALSLIPFAIWWLIIPSPESGQRIPLEFFLIPGHWFLLLALYHLYTLKNGGNIRWIILGLSLSFGFSFYFIERSNIIILLIVFIFFVWMLYNENLTRIPKGIRLSFAEKTIPWLILILVVVGFSISMKPIRQALQRDWSNKYYNRYNEKLVKGFSASTILGGYAKEWNLKEDKKIALKIWSDKAPGYLQGGVYRRYRWGVWEEELDWKEMFPRGQKVDHGIYSLEQVQFIDSGLTMVYPEILARRYFVPAMTGQIASVKDSLHGNKASVFKPIKGRLSNRGYYYYPSNPRLTFFNQPDNLDLQIPEILNDKLDSILVMLRSQNPKLENWIIGSSNSFDSLSLGNSQEFVKEIVKSIDRWFLNDFEYSLETDWGLNKEPTLEFLKRKKGYCEFFATTGTLLLRRAGIPARYVKGFSPPQKLGDFWVVRRANAHAWLKYWEADSMSLRDKGRWVLAELTPPDYNPKAQLKISATEQFLEAWTGKIERFFSIIREGQWREKIRNLETVMNTLLEQKYLGWLLLLLLFLLFFLKRKMMFIRWKTYRSGVKLSVKKIKSEESLLYQQQRKSSEDVLIKLNVYRPFWMPLGIYIEKASQDLVTSDLSADEIIQVKQALEKLESYWKWRFSADDDD